MVADDDEKQPPWLIRADYRPEEEFFEPIGEMMWAFGWLDHQVDLALISLLQVDRLEVVQAVLSQIGRFEAKIDLFSQLANLRFSDSSKAELIKQIHDDLDEVNGKRNHIVHGRGSSFVWPPLRIAISRDRPQSEKFGTKRYFYEPQEISEITNKMIKAGTVIGQLKWEINKLFEPKRPKE